MLLNNLAQPPSPTASPVLVPRPRCGAVVNEGLPVAQEPPADQAAQAQFVLG